MPYLTYYNSDMVKLYDIPTEIGNYYVKASVPLVVVTENGEEIRYEASESNYITFKINHNLTHTDVKEPTCTEYGNIAYWYCSECNRYFSDEKAENKIKLSDTVISKIDHSFKNYVSNNYATCTEDGTKTAKCDRCDATDTITEKATGHNLTHIDRNEPTSTNKGNIEYWQCENCEKYFSDKDCVTEINLSDTEIPMVTTVTTKSTTATTETTTTKATTKATTANTSSSSTTTTASTTASSTTIITGETTALTTTTTTVPEAATSFTEATTVSSEATTTITTLTPEVTIITTNSTIESTTETTTPATGAKMLIFPRPIIMVLRLWLFLSLLSV